MEKNMNRREMLKGIAGGVILSLAGKNVLASDSDKQVSSHPQMKFNKEKTMNQNTTQRFNLNDSIIMLVDHQRGTIDWVKSQPKEQVIGATRALARMAVEYGMPLILTTTMEDRMGPSIDDLQHLAPDAFANRYKRGGALSCWSEPKLKADVKALNRKNIIIAGLTTDICGFWAAYDAVKQGYNVMFVADACGSLSVLADQLTFDRLRDMGVVVCGINQAQTELVNDFGTADGQKAMKINMEEVISRLGK
jgi:nicotinamidase-related amidase